MGVTFCEAGVEGIVGDEVWICLMEDFGADVADGEAPKATEGTSTPRRPSSSVRAPLAKCLEESARNAVFTADNNGAIDVSTPSRSSRGNGLRHRGRGQTVSDNG